MGAGGVRVFLGLLALVALFAGCGGGSGSPLRTTTTPPTVVLRPDQRPVPIGRGSSFMLPPTSGAVGRRAPVARMRCLDRHPSSYGVHLELYANRFVLPVPAGIGVAPPLRRSGAYVRGGACSYPVRTLEPTGLVLVDLGTRARVADLFRLWGQRLSARALARFHGEVQAFVDGRPWRGSPGVIPLARHSNIVLEVGGSVPPHPAYLFPPGT